MRVVFVGHVSVDINVIGGKEYVQPGGGVVHGAITARCLGADVSVLTRCAAEDRQCFPMLAEAGVPATFLDSARSTSIRNEYPTDNPDDRVSRLVAGGDPFREEDLPAPGVDVLHVNPLWHGEFPPLLLAQARGRARVLGADAQGFLRCRGEDGLLSLRPWPEAGRFLPLLDVFKADLKEARILVGDGSPADCARRLRDLGAGAVVLTHRDGVCICDRSGTHEAPFSGWTVEGRTGRGDTCTAAWLVARERMDGDEAAAFAARITSEKMRYPGPYRGGVWHRDRRGADGSAALPEDGVAPPQRAAGRA